jgi:hypothetical protein
LKLHYTASVTSPSTGVTGNKSHHGTDHRTSTKLRPRQWHLLRAAVCSWLHEWQFFSPDHLSIVYWRGLVSLVGQSDVTIISVKRRVPTAFFGLSWIVLKSMVEVLKAWFDDGLEEVIVEVVMLCSAT